MLSLYMKGSMKLAGPFADNAGGAVLLEVSDEAEAKAIVMKNPAVGVRDLCIRYASLETAAMG